MKLKKNLLHRLHDPRMILLFSEPFFYAVQHSKIFDVEEGLTQSYIFDSQKLKFDVQTLNL